MKNRPGEALFFNERERAALAPTDALILIADSEADRHFAPAELAHAIWQIAATIVGTWSW